jgi:hypothetical protein
LSKKNDTDQAVIPSPTIELDQDENLAPAVTPEQTIEAEQLNRQDFSKRDFFRFVGITTAVAIADKFLLQPALGGTWQKLTPSGGPANTWQKLTLATYINQPEVTSIACGARSSYALRSDGLVYGTGHNLGGILGDNTASIELLS